MGSGWVFQEGTGATTVSQGLTGKDPESLASTLHLLGTNADVFCMLKDTGPTASDVEGPGIGFWVYWFVLPMTVIISAMIVMIAFSDFRPHKGKAALKAQKGTVSRVYKPFNMSDR